MRIEFLAADALAQSKETRTSSSGELLLNSRQAEDSKWSSVRHSCSTAGQTCKL